ncbi:MAG: type II secretion system F family protein [Phycisphaerae bacterium]|jgi:tight adherence protein C|nr:type II secretion system F family protein [Phycisphaerae bacterium]
MPALINIVTILASASYPNEGIFDIALSGGIFLVVTLFVVAIFRQPYEITVSHQRQSAIETGHGDRQTVFENTLLRPILWIMLSGAFRMAVPRFKEWIRKTLVSAGNPNYYSPEEYLALSLFYGAMIAVAVSLFYMITPLGFSFVSMMLGFLVGMGLTIYQLREAAGKRLRLIAKRVPYALDLISLAMGAGATFTEAIATVVRERGDDPFNEELKVVLAEIELGTTRRQALQNLATRIPIDMLRSIVASVIQAEDLGTPLADVLHSQASLLRLQRSVRAENLAAVASVRIMVPASLILLSVILAVFGPAVVRFIESGGIF